MENETTGNEKKNRKWVYPLLGTGFILLGLFYFLLLFTGNLFTHNIFVHLSNFTISWIFVYAGVQYIKKENLGSRLIACTIPTIFFLPLQSVIFIFLELIVKYLNPKSISASWESGFIGILIVTTICVWGILLILHTRKQNNNLTETDITHSVKISRIISILSPGFAHILLGKDKTDYSIYIFYFIIQYSLGWMAVFFGNKSNIGDIGYWFFMFISLLVWLSFILNELSYIKEHKESMDKESQKQNKMQELPPISDINQDIQGEA
jgi:hypothetical protein